MWDLSPAPFDGEKHAPSSHGQIKLLTPPSTPGFLRHDLKSILVDGRVTQPSGQVKTTGMLPATKRPLVAEDAET